MSQEFFEGVAIEGDGIEIGFLHRGDGAHVVHVAIDGDGVVRRFQGFRAWTRRQAGFGTIGP